MKHPPVSVLKLSLPPLLLALLLAAGGVWWSRGQAQDAAQLLQRQQHALDDARQQLDRARQQQQLVAAYLAEYRTLAARGFIGPEHRLAWIEAAQFANRDAGLYGLDYRLTPRTPAPPGLAQGLPLGHTAMTLTLPLLVETDLARFLGALKARAPGVVRVQGCALSRQTQVPFEAIDSPQLQAECEVLWFTVADHSGGDA
jgi:hypothetical protein